MKLTMDNLPGVITLPDWSLAPNGKTYIHLWCKDWRVITDKDVPVDGFRSTEKWQLLAMVNNTVMAVIPGCQVKAWMRCNTPPDNRSCYNFGDS